MTIKKLESGRYSVTGNYGSTQFHVGIFDHLDDAERAERQLGNVQPAPQVFSGNINLSLSLADAEVTE